MAYILSIKGHEDTRVDDIRGENIKEDWIKYKQGKKKNDVITIESTGFTGTLSDIYNFKQVPDKDDRNDEDKEKQDKIRKINKEHYQAYVAKVDNPPEDKASDLTFAESWHEIITGSDEMTEGERMRYMGQQMKFFRENPNRTLPNLKTLDAVTSKNQARSDKQMEALSYGALARLMAEMIGRDMQYARNKKQ